MTRTTKSRAAFTAALGAALVLLAGCSPASSPPPTAPGGVPQAVLSASSKEVKAALADGNVTRDEYDAAYRRFAVCMQAGGTALIEYPMKEDTYQYGYPAAAAALEKKCYNKQYYAVDMVWQVAHPTVATRLQTCLVLAGDSFVGTVDEMRAQLIKDGQDPDRCLTKKIG